MSEFALLDISKFVALIFCEDFSTAFGTRTSVGKPVKETDVTEDMAALRLDRFFGDASRVGSTNRNKADHAFKATEFVFEGYLVRRYSRRLAAVPGVVVVVHGCCIGRA